MKIAVVALTLLCAVPLRAEPSDTEKVLNAVIPSAGIHLRAHGHWPSILSAKTSGGSEFIAREWLILYRGRVIGDEMADAYQSANASETWLPKAILSAHPSADLRPLAVGDSYNWVKFAEEFPRARSVVVMSEPAFDSSGGMAFVRIDFISPRGPDASGAMFYYVERQADGSWKISRLGGAPYKSVREDLHLHPPETRELFH